MGRRQRLRATTLQPPLGHIDGLIMSHDTDTAHDIALSNGEATMIQSASAVRVVGNLTTSLVKRLDADWADGTTNGGIASGARTSDNVMNVDTWYHYFIISKGGGGGRLDAGVDTSTTATNLLADATEYNYYRRVGSVLSDGSSNVTAFIQFADTFLWQDPPLDVDATTTAATYPISVPTGFSMLAFVNQYAGDLHYVHTPDTDDETPALAAAPLGTQISAVGLAGTAAFITTDTSAQIRIRSAVSMVRRVATLGWIDPRGRAST